MNVTSCESIVGSGVVRSGVVRSGVVGSGVVGSGVVGSKAVDDWKNYEEVGQTADRNI